MKINKLVIEEINKYVNNIICESLTDIVYHFTDYNAIISIIQTDTCKLSNPLKNNQIEKPLKGYSYYLSLTRQKNGEVAYSKDKPVRIILDGRKLSYRYKATPINYYGKYFGNYETKFDYTIFENEDRLLSNKPEINNFSQYVISYDILADFDYKDFLKSLLSIEANPNKLHFYVKKQDFIYGNDKYLLADNFKEYFLKNADNYENNVKNMESIDHFDFHGCNYMSEYKNGFAKIGRDGKYNFLNKEGKLVNKTWFDKCEDFHDGLAKICIYGKGCNYIDKNIKLLSDVWFKTCEGFNDGLARVQLGYKWNFIDTNGNLITDRNNELRGQWFDSCCMFNNNLARVELNNKWNFINKNGELLSPNLWFNDSYDFNNRGFAKVLLDNKNYYIDTHGNLHDNIK